MQTTTSLRKGDLVQVMVGRSRGKTGKILRVDLKKARVFIEKVNTVKRHMRPSKSHPQGGILEKEAPVRWSQVMLVCGACVKPVRTRRRAAKDGVWERTCIRCEKVVGGA